MDGGALQLDQSVWDSFSRLTTTIIHSCISEAPSIYKPTEVAFTIFICNTRGGIDKCHVHACLSASLVILVCGIKRIY